MKRAAFIVILVLACRRPPAPAALQVSHVLAGSDDAGFAHALAPRPFVFPVDHGAHPDFRSEWWYVTGNLRAGARRFGYQLTIFRQALAPDGPPRASAWASRQVYMAHLAITDGAGRFVAFERLSRDGLALAGAEASPFRVWLEDWQMQGLFPMTLTARAAGAAIALTLGPGRGPVLQGDDGLSRKGPEPGNASYYYSFTRLPTRGRLTIGGEVFDVTGTSWLDREWSTSALAVERNPKTGSAPPAMGAAEQSSAAPHALAAVGWDWLALQLADGRDLMVYRLRRQDGSAAPESRATLIDDRGHTRLFDSSAFSLVADRWWRSPHTGARYPVAVTVRVPAEHLALEVRPLVDDQELRLSLRYWEGAVSARAVGVAIAGEGYLELTGYAP